ncbi:hypothetical protein DFJ58DRAFT_910338 [Suillus subalutaceus]|uniref:uncharacterized protein n=1 Tax=Suillus subalutaceus TaxID=48586 RepID=UPI001B877EF2|nr:uncharacterized protein DFJ58DRAFT_910338 [Suillus subalutaceus]KAG1873526.1 hypothetical protein DFJ58DRAFT_910338 [Suillus subalutaceus]
MCFELFDSHVMMRSSIISQHEAASAFRGAQSLPVDAALCAIRSGNPRWAVELVEQGRGQQWSLASRLRTPLEDLESTSPQLAQRLSELSRRLSDAQGFSRFLLPSSFTDLQAAARHGPVIILIASQYLCGAIIVPTSGEPHQVCFPRITLLNLEKLKDDFATAIRHTARMRPEEPRKTLRVLLQMVWNEIMLPIVNVLQYDLQLYRRSRIWLCPTAAFTSILLHAANPFRMKADRSGPEACPEDIYICSYTPTLSALIRSRQMMKMRVTPSFAAIGQSQPGAGQGSLLAAVDRELELVHKLVPSNFSGFKSVIGTLWAVNDALAKYVVEAFYERMSGDLEDGGVMDCTKAAWALNNAAASVEKKVPLEQRIVFIHIVQRNHRVIQLCLSYTLVPSSFRTNVSLGKNSIRIFIGWIPLRGLGKSSQRTKHINAAIPGPGSGAA